MAMADSKVLKKIKDLESLFCNGRDDEVILQVVDTTVDKLLRYEEQKFGRELRDIQRSLRRFEKKYEMKSDSFYRKFSKGKLGDSMDYIEWSALCDIQRRISDRLDKLKAAGR